MLCCAGNSIHFRHMNGCSWESVKVFETENVSTWGGLESATSGFMQNALAYWAIRARHLLSQVVEYWLWRYWYFWSKVNMWNVKLTVRRQQHSFSTYERVFWGKCQIFWGRKCPDLRGTRTPNIRIHAECSNLLNYHGQTFAVPCGWILALLRQKMPYLPISLFRICIIHIIFFYNNAVEITTYDHTDMRNWFMLPNNVGTWISQNVFWWKRRMMEIWLYFRDLKFEWLLCLVKLWTIICDHIYIYIYIYICVCVFWPVLDQWVVGIYYQPRIFAIRVCVSQIALWIVIRSS